MLEFLIGGAIALFSTVTGGGLAYAAQAAAQRRADADAGALAVASLDDYLYAHSKLSRLNAQLSRIDLLLRRLVPRSEREAAATIGRRFANLARKAWFSSHERYVASNGGDAPIDEDLRVQLDAARASLEEIFHRVVAAPLRTRRSGVVRPDDVASSDSWKAVVDTHDGP